MHARKLAGTPDTTPARKPFIHKGFGHHPRSVSGPSLERVDQRAEDLQRLDIARWRQDVLSRPRLRIRMAPRPDPRSRGLDVVRRASAAEPSGRAVPSTRPRRRTTCPRCPGSPPAARRPAGRTACACARRRPALPTRPPAPVATQPPGCRPAPSRRRGEASHGRTASRRDRPRRGRPSAAARRAGPGGARSSRAAVARAPSAFGPGNDFPSYAVMTSRSQLPCTQTARSPSESSRSSDSAGNGPSAMSPSSTTRSAAATSGSASTASRAGRLPWMSERTATRMSRSCLSRRHPASHPPP